MVGSVLHAAASLLSAESAFCPISPTCPVGDTCQYEYGAVSLIVDCATEFAGGDLQTSTTPTLAGCMEACALNKDCVATSYIGETCHLKDTRGLAKPNPDVTGISVIRRDKDAQIGAPPSPPSAPSGFTTVTLTVTPTPSPPSAPFDFTTVTVTVAPTPSDPSGFTTVTLTVTPTPSPTAWEPSPPLHPPLPEPRQLLVNPGFEDETLDAWAFEDDYVDEGDNVALKLERSDNDYHSGNFSLRVLPNEWAAPWRLTLTQSKIKYKPLAEYNVSLWVKDHSASCLIRYFWNKIELTAKCEGTYGWSQCAAVMPSWMTDGYDGDWAELTAFISCPAYVSGRFYIDDFTMTEIYNPINDHCFDKVCGDEFEEDPDKWKPVEEVGPNDQDA